MSHRSYRTRPLVPADADEALSAYAALFCRGKRILHARLEATHASSLSFKSALSQELGLTARQFNALRVEVDGQRRAVTACRDTNMDTLRDRNRRLGKQIALLEQELQHGRLNRDKTQRRRLTRRAREQALFALHQKKRRLATGEARLARLAHDVKSNRVRLCFGSRALLRAQYRLAENGFSSRANWLASWRAARSNQFMVLGSKDEQAGCQGCQATLQADGTLQVTIRLPDALAGQYGKHVTLTGVRFAYGQGVIEQALALADARKIVEKEARHGAKAAGVPYSAASVAIGSALTWRFKRDEKGWEVFVAVDAAEAPRISQSAAGFIGVDINADHLAVAEIDYFGNPVSSFSLPCHTQGRTTEQAAAAIGDAVKALMAYATRVKKPVVLEDLDFKKKKRALMESDNTAYKRMLSAFAYQRIRSLIDARCRDAGIETRLINPAYTSVQGRVHYARPLGITVHQAAAIVIARRARGAQLRLPRAGRTYVLPVKGSVTTWTSPDWMKKRLRLSANPWREVVAALSGPRERAAVRTPRRATGGGAPPPGKDG
jgi:IS605 OrfB family transposase